jgi:SAM-dependent methyltransferase
VDSLYRDRKLAYGFPDLDSLALEKYMRTVNCRSAEEATAAMERRLEILDRLIPLHRYRRILEVGCGPKPFSMQYLLGKGYEVTGVEPVPYFVEEARAYLGNRDLVLAGSAEAIPLPDESQDIAFLDSVLEHVDSPMATLKELQRVLAPEGIAAITTTNRLRLSPRGYEAEFNVRFYGWLPATVKESFVFHHLHHDPSLANYTERPAVHWFSYAALCDLGRSAGFFQFYSSLDLQDVGDRPGPGSGTFRRRVRRALLPRIQASPWLRSLALMQRGGEIIMLKRPSAGGPRSHLC